MVPATNFPRNPFLLVVAALGLVQIAAAEDWKPQNGKLMTPFAEDVSPEKTLPEYPRPQLVREDWRNLNGLWDYAITTKDAPQPSEYQGKILIPFAIESALSGVAETVGKEKALWYRRSFEVPADWKGKRLRLHFGAVDWECTVRVNGEEAGKHVGGYDPFWFDITGALRNEGRQEIVVRVWDPTDAGYQPRGKQVERPHGIWYTSVTGIWQTVWMEPVPEAAIDSLHILPDLDSGVVRVEIPISGAQAGQEVTVSVSSAGKEIATSSAKVRENLAVAEVKVDQPHAWSPDDPFLYDLSVELQGQESDRVASYFGFRKIELKPDSAGVNRLFLNNKPLFQFGPLDQGWWPDGLYTPPTDEALRYDIEVTKKLGFNMCRKHVKVESARWYYWCDKLGLLVWQDMPNGDRHIGPDQPDIVRSEESADNYRREWRAMMKATWNHPCVVVWVPFNEGWGQFSTNEILAETKKFDPTRLVDGPSGWTDRGAGDMHDMHAYPGPSMPPVEEKRASVLGEYGGLGWPAPDHLWQQKDNWGYRTYHSQEDLAAAYESLTIRLHPLIAEGLAAAVYTQTTDVEGEVNGLMTYDRKVIKLPNIAEMHRRLYLPPPVFKELVATSEKQGQSWRYTMEKPQQGWQNADFDDSGWKTGAGGFGREDTPGAVVRTQWQSEDIWIRRTFELAAVPAGEIYLKLHHDEDAQIFINGKQAAAVTDYTTGYIHLPLSQSADLQKGKNTLAVHCRQTRGGQYIDVGLMEAVGKE